MSNAINPSNYALVELRRFYLALSLLLAVLATIGFWPLYFGPFLAGKVNTDLVIHVHVSVYVGWLALFIAQCALVAFGHVALHRKIGKFGLVWGFIVIVVGLTTTFVRFVDRLSEGGIERAENFGVWPVIDMVVFASFLGAAAVHRRRPENHKRLMIVAATSILVASLGRFTSFDPDSAASHTILLALWMSPILLAMAHDYFRQRIVHPVFVVGVLVLGASSFRDPIRFSDSWINFTHWLAAVIT